jgi:hypothetical protein
MYWRGEQRCSSAGHKRERSDRVRWLFCLYLLLSSRQQIYKRSGEREPVSNRLGTTPLLTVRSERG